MVGAGSRVVPQEKRNPWCAPASINIVTVRAPRETARDTVWRLGRSVFLTSSEIVIIADE